MKALRFIVLFVLILSAVSYSGIILLGQDGDPKEVLGETTVDLVGDYELNIIQETNVGNFVADVYRETQGTQLGLINGGAMDHSVAAGPITRGDVDLILPFADSIVTFNITGEQLLAALEHSVIFVEDQCRFLQVSGLTFTYDSSQPEGSRVVEVLVAEEALDAEDVYSVATNNYLAGGGDDYAVFLDATDVLDTMQIEDDVLAQYIRDAMVISPEVEGRIVDVASPEYQDRGD